jgi:hypothetical protein
MKKKSEMRLLIHNLLPRQCLTQLPWSIHNLQPSPLTLSQALHGSPNLSRLGRGKLAEKRATE